METVMGSFLLVVLGLFGGGFFGLPLATPPLPADPVVERAAPAECLAHFELRGLAAAAAGSPNQTERLLAEEEVQEFTAAFAAEAAKVLTKAVGDDPRARALAEKLTLLARVIATRPAALTLIRLTLPGAEPPAIEASLVVNVGAERDAFQEAFAAGMAELLRNAPPGVEVATVAVAGGEWSRLKSVDGSPEITWGFRGDHFVLTLGDGVLEKLLERLGDETREPPTWKAEALKRMPVERLSTLAHVDVAAVLKLVAEMSPNPDLQRVLDATGASSIRSVSAVTGLSGLGLSASTWLAFAGEPRGVFAPGANAALRPEDLAVIPADAVMAHAWKLDLAATLAQVATTLEAVEPTGAEGLRGGLAAFRQALGLDLDADILAALGDTWRVVLLPGGGPLVPSAAILADVRDRGRLEKSHAALLERFRQAAADPASGLDVTVKETDYRGTKVFSLESATPLPLTPSWCITDDGLVVTVSPQLLRTLLGRKPDDGSLADVQAVRDAVTAGGGVLLGYLEPKALVNSLCGTYEMLAPMARAGLAEQGIVVEPPALPAPQSILPHTRPSVSIVRRVAAEGMLMESRGTLPLGPLSSGNGIVGGTPATAGVLVGLLLPAVQSAREAARRTQGMNNMRQLMIAMHIHSDAKRSGFPAPAICDAAGKPLLSWRVTVLPYLEDAELYKEFHLDEPWDSEHNKQLLERMPEVFRDPAGPAGGTTTTYVMPTGAGTLFPRPGVGPKLEDVTDGASNTVALVEVSREHAVPWTKPGDVVIDAADPAVALRGARPGGFLAGFADGSIQMLDVTMVPERLRAFFTPDAGDAVIRD